MAASACRNKSLVIFAVALRCPAGREQSGWRASLVSHRTPKAGMHCGYMPATSENLAVAFTRPESRSLRSQVPGVLLSFR